MTGAIGGDEPRLREGPTRPRAVRAVARARRRHAMSVARARGGAAKKAGDDTETSRFVKGGKRKKPKRTPKPKPKKVPKDDAETRSL